MKLKNSITLFAVSAALALPLSADDKATEVKPTGKAPSEAIQGYWVPDKEAFLKAMLAQVPDGAKADEAAIASMKGMVEAMAAKMAFHFSDGETEMITPGGLEKAEWKAISEEAKTGAMKLTITKPNGKTEDSEVIVGKETMIVINREQNMQVACKRVTEEEYKRRVKMAETELGAGDAPE